MGKFGTCADGDQHRQKGDERHDGIDKTHAHILQCRGKTHGVFLHTLGGPFDMAQVLPVRHIVLIHCGTPAQKYIVADKEVVQRTDHHGDKRNTETPPLRDKIDQSDLVRRAGRR